MVDRVDKTLDLESAEQVFVATTNFRYQTTLFRLTFILKINHINAKFFRK
jgi:hypothetical protein